ncbi:MAG: hypothetical protein OHK0017_00470 [Patescibacteria group bacterium]
MQPLTIIAGPCSVDYQNIAEIEQIAQIKVEQNGMKIPAISGARVVGLKSRTELKPEEGVWVGIDYEAIIQNLEIYANGGSVNDYVQLPSVEIGSKIQSETGLQIASEILLPSIQLPCVAREFKNKPFLAWLPAVNQLGWSVLEMANFAKRNGWSIGLKNGKWIGSHYSEVERTDYTGSATSLEKTWSGLISYAKKNNPNEVVLIQRGVEDPDKADLRNRPIHHTACRIKMANPGQPMYFDPSHVYGPKSRHIIIQETVKAMQIKLPNGSYLYDGVLIEVGTSKSDTDQHISITELDDLCQKLSQVRELNFRNSSK